LALKKMKHYEDRCLLIKHEALYNSPQIEVNKIINFIDVSISEKKRDNLYNIPQKPDSVNRFKHHDLSIFDNNQLEFVKEMGFEI